MRSLCEFDATDTDDNKRCKFCGAVVPSRVKYRNCGGRPAPIVCPHLGNNTGESVKTINCGCGNSTAIFECDLFLKDCAPYVRSKRGMVERDDVLLCRDCEHNPANQAATPATTTPE